MKKLPHLILIMCLLTASCRENVNPPKLQDNNTGGVQTIGITSLLFNGTAKGCGNFVVYRDTEDRTKVVEVHAGTKALNLKTTPQTYDIGTTPTLQVAIHDYGNDKHSLLEYCSDSIREDALRPQFIYATAGKVTIHISKKKVEYGHFPAYAITVTLENVTFPVTNGISYHIEKAEIKDVMVGWLA
jgi:hypothetical protein